MTALVQVSLNCLEILESKHCHVFLLEASFMGMTMEKDHKHFLQQFCWFGTCFYSSALVFSKMWHSGSSSWKQLKFGSLNCL